MLRTEILGVAWIQDFQRVHGYWRLGQWGLRQGRWQFCSWRWGRRGTAEEGANVATALPSSVTVVTWWRHADNDAVGQAAQRWWSVMLKGDKRVLFRRKNSSLRDVDVGELLALISSWTTLAHEGAALESEGLAGSMVGCCWVPPPTPLFSLPSTPMKGEAGRWGEGCNSVAPACLSMPSCKGGVSYHCGVLWLSCSPIYGGEGGVR